MSGGAERGQSQGFIVVSGLPASGKTWISAAIAPLLGLPFLDKDDSLEALYDSRGIGDANWRTRLSRESDDLLRAAALDAGAAILTSFWRHLGQTGGGTPSEWLEALPGPLVEVHCDCPAGVALERFLNRNRHPGHLDAERDVADLQRKFEGYAARGPLGLGTTIVVDTTDYPDLVALAARIGRVLGQGA
jgi:glucokinase